MNTRSSNASIPFFLFLGVLAISLVVAALIVAFVVNPIELPVYAAEVSLSWDPTHTAEKYLLLGLLAAAGGYWIFRSGRPAFSIAFVPAAMLAVAVPVGAAGYEAVAH